MDQVGSKLPEAALEGLLAHGSTGALEITESQAQALAQQLPSGNSPRSDFTPADIQMYYREAVAAAVDAANDLVTSAGVNDLDGFYAHLESSRRGELHEIRDAFARGNAQPLVRAAQQYVASHGSGVDAVTAERLLDPSNQVNGGRIYRGENGTVMVQIDGAHGPMTLAQAVAGGHVRISKDEEEE
jgi:hypothetical protein